MTTTPKWLIDVIHITARSTSFRYQNTLFIRIKTIVITRLFYPTINVSITMGIIKPRCINLLAFLDSTNIHKFYRIHVRNLQFPSLPLQTQFPSL